MRTLHSRPSGRKGQDRVVIERVENDVENLWGKGVGD